MKSGIFILESSIIFGMEFCNHCKMNYDGERCPICHRKGTSDQQLWVNSRKSYDPPIKHGGKNAGRFLGIILVIVLSLIAIPFGMIFLDINFMTLIPEGRDLEIILGEGNESEHEEQTSFSLPDIIPKDFNLFDDGILTYKIDPIPSNLSQSSMVKKGVNDGLNFWSKKNPELVFEEISSGKPDIAISWLEFTGTHSGFGCVDCLRYGATIEVVLEELDCNGGFVQYDKGTITNIVAHEFGHNLGLEHNVDENHLMWSDIDPQIPYDTLSYNIPDRVPEYFLGYKELKDKHDLLSKEIEEQGKEHDLLTSKYNQFPEQTRSEGEYQRAMQAYNELNLLTEDMNRKVDQANQLVEVLNCYPNTSS